MWSERERCEDRREVRDMWHCWHLRQRKGATSKGCGQPLEKAQKQALPEGLQKGMEPCQHPHFSPPISALRWRKSLACGYASCIQWVVSMGSLKVLPASPGFRITLKDHLSSRVLCGVRWSLTSFSAQSCLPESFRDTVPKIPLQ